MVLKGEFCTKYLKAKFFTNLKFFLILLTHKESHRKVNQEFQRSPTLSAGGAKGCSDQKFCVPPAYTARLRTLHLHRADSQYRMANQI